ncbi:MAG: class I SAM-dependent methyltransferase [Ferruginibacter sp.]
MQAFFLQQLVGKTDIYLIDQIIKGRYKAHETLLDAGCGNGRNLHWFLLNHLECFGVDQSSEAIAELSLQYPSLDVDRWKVSEVEEMSYLGETFDHVICSAVLHFAKSKDHFYKMLTEIVRVLKTGGSLFIRMASNIGIEERVVHTGDGNYLIPDETSRFLLTKILLSDILTQQPLLMLEPIKTVNVNDIRCMTTLVMQKKI